jgi:hypothetical protein
MPVIRRDVLIKRINRQLIKDQEKLRKTRGERLWIDLGDYYIQDMHRNIIEHHITDERMEELGRELGVI